MFNFSKKKKFSTKIFSNKKNQLKRKKDNIEEARLKCLKGTLKARYSAYSNIHITCSNLEDFIDDAKLTLEFKPHTFVPKVSSEYTGIISIELKKNKPCIYFLKI